MRYLVFNVTVLAALAYLFMASPHQSFANWIGKAPQMFDAARTAGRDHRSGEDPDATAGHALLEAVEPVVEQALSSSDDADASPAPAARFSQSISTDEIQTVEAPADPVHDAARPVTIQDIEGIIRGLLDARVKTCDDPAGSAGVDTPVRQRVTRLTSSSRSLRAVQQSGHRQVWHLAPLRLTELPTNAAPNKANEDGSRAVESPTLPCSADAVSKE